MVPWFAVTAELLGDVIRLAWHWHETDRRREAAVAAAAHAQADAGGGDNVRVGGAYRAQRRQGGFSKEVVDRLSFADWALYRLSQAMEQQVAVGHKAGPDAAAGHIGVHASHSTSSLGELAGADAAVGAGYGSVNMAASMDALAVQMLSPTPDVDKLFTLMLMHKEHVLTGMHTR